MVFDSYSSNLVESDVNHSLDVFVHDRQLGTTERISVSSYGIQGDRVSGISSISSDGRYVVFGSLASDLTPDPYNGTVNIYVHDRQLGMTRLISTTGTSILSDDQSSVPRISSNGIMVAFVSSANNLVPGDTNGSQDVFVRNITMYQLLIPMVEDSQ